VIATSAPATTVLYRPRARFFGAIPENYETLNRDLLRLTALPAAEPPLPDRVAWHQAAHPWDLERAVKVLPLPEPIPRAISAFAIRGMESLRDLGVLSALRGGRRTDLARPAAGRMAREIRRHAPGLIELVEHLEAILAGSDLFVRSIKLDAARASTTAPSSDPKASNLHFDAEKSSLAEYSEPIWQFYLNAGQLERQFRILPIVREGLFAEFSDAERSTLPLRTLLERHLATHRPVLETVPIESGALAIFDGRRFAHDAGKSDPKALARGRFEPSSEPDLVVALDTVETGYHQGLYRPERSFLEDRGVRDAK
jgi:hypothetical protein